MTTVAGIFESPIDANKAITDLLEMGVGRETITLLMSDKTKHKFQSAASTEPSRIGSDAVTGSISGGVLGALIAGLTAFSTVIIPGAGLLVAGPLISIAAGLGAGVVAGGLAGVLIGAGLSQNDTDKYVDAVNSGKAVVLVHDVPSDELTSVRSILSELASSTRAA